ncbi:MAG TPA: hypothetical protein VFU25_10870 [Ornithinibacter sp.]|nr:hypothetical protein [Ornithinibacter sp.]
MGNDPRRLDGLRADEHTAAVLVEHATGATARAHDVGARQGVHDIDLAYPDGRTAALEVTTHAGSGVRHAPALLGRDRTTWPNPGRWSWTVGIGNPRDIPRLRALYQRAITACEAHEVTTVGGLPDDVLARDPELRWVVSTSTSTVVGRPEASRNVRAHGGVVVLPVHEAARADADLVGLPCAVTELLTVPHVARRAAKVAAVSRVDERHLFVGIGDGGLPAGLYLALARPVDAVPTDAPEVPEGLSHVWLTTAWSGAPLLGWVRGSGWQSHAVERTASR